MSKAKDVVSKGNSSSKQVKHKSAKNKGVSSLKNVSSQSANNASGHRLGVAAVALASTLSMLLPGATALAKTPLNADSFDSSYVKSAAKTSGKGAGKGNGKGDGNDLYKNGLLNTGATSERAMRQMVGSAKEYLVKHADSNADSNNSAAGVDNHEAAAGDSSVSVKDSGERSYADSKASNDAGSEAGDDASFETGSEAATDSATETATKGEQDNSDVAKSDSKAAKKEQSAEAKPAETPAAKTEQTNTDSAKTDPAKTEVVNPTPAAKTADASNPEPANSEPAAKTDSETKTNSSANTEPDQKSAQPASTENAQPAAKNEKEKAAPSTANADSENAKAAAEQPAAEQSASTASTQPAAKSENDSTTPKVRNRRDVNQSAKDSNKGSSVTAEGADAGALSTDRSGEGANGSNNNSNANSQVIKPNEKNQTAESQNEANEQVQTDKKPRATYNLQIRYTIGGAPNKQLVQPYELTIDEAKLKDLDKPENYVYVKLPKSAGYNPAVYHSGNYQYYIEKSKGKYVIDDGMHADADRYLRLDKNLIKEYAVKQRQVVGGNNSDQTSQNTSSSQAPAKDGIQYYGELNVNYAPKTAKYYIRHMVQDADNRNEFAEAKNVPGVKTLTVGDKQIHVTEVTGTVGSNVSAVSVYIPGYEPEHNLISSPLSDSEDEKDKLVLNLRYYRKAYDVTYDSAGGTDVTAQKVYYKQNVPPVTNPTKRGYMFKGWHIVDPAESTANTQNVNFDASSPMPDHDVKLRAVWVANNTTSYRVNVWVQKADLVDKDNLNSLANYDFVGLVERKNVKTGSSVDLDNMSDAGVVADERKLNGTDKDNPILDSELGLTKEELQGKSSDHKDGLISKFNWMNDTPVTSLDGYDANHPGAESNKGKDLFTRYFKVNKKLTNKLNESKKTLKANDLKNTIDLVYDRNEYELIFANPANTDKSDYNPRIRRKDSKGDYVTYCYAGSAGCSTELNKKDYETYKLDGKEINSKIDHKGYRVKVRYGQKLNDVWPSVYELSFEKDKDGIKRGSLGFLIGYAGDYKYRDTPPYRFTKEEFADPSLRAVFKKDQKDKVEPRISYNPLDPNAKQYELKDNQRLLVADSSLQNNVIPVHVAIEKQSIASAKNCDKDKNIKYELSADSYSKDDTNSTYYMASAPSIAGFDTVEKKVKPQYLYEEDDVSDDNDGFFEKLYQESDYYKEKNRKEWSDLEDDEQKEFRKRYNLAFRSNIGTADAEVDDDAYFDKNFYAEFKYNRKSYDVQFYNADGNAIKDGSVAATEELPFEYSLTKRGKRDLTGEDKDLYGNDASYDASVTKVGGTKTATQFDGKYTFTLNNKTYSIVRPYYLPKDYVFKGWAVDQAGRHLINGEINDNSEGAEGGSESGSKAKGEVKDYTVPVNGIKLYAAWGKPEGVKHTVTFDYNMPKTDDNGKEIKDSNVVTETKFPRYHVIDENKLGTPTRKGYDFYGWELAKKGNETLTNHTPYAFGNKVVEDITLKAVWIEDTRYNGTFNHIFLKPGVTIDDYKKATDDTVKAAMVDHISTQTVSGLREHLRYNAEAVYSDETHFPDKHFTSFEASNDESQNTGEFIYQTYNTRKYKVKYVDQNGKELLPESEVRSVNQKYDVAFYKPIEGFMPRESQQNIIYTTDDDGKQNSNKEITFTYDDVRVLKRKDDTQHRPDHYTRYVFKVDDKQSSMGSVVDWQGSKVADGSALVYDAIKGTKAYQMPLPTVKAKPGYEFEKWTSKIYIDNVSGGQTESDGFKRLPILSESQSNPKVVYTANFKLKAPVAIDTKVLKPTDALTLDEASAKKLITNANDYPTGATFSFAPSEKFDSTPGLHKIKVQVKLDGNTAETEVLYRVLPDLVYESDWDKFKATGYGSTHKDDYVPIKFTGSNDKGKLIGHDSDNADTPGGTTTLTAYAYKGKEVRIRVPQAFGKEYEDDHYHYVFKGWTTGTQTDPAKISNYDIKSEDRYKKDTFSNDVTYHAVYKRIDYFSSSSDGGEVPKDAVVAIFKPAPGRLWKDGTSGPKVFYVKKGTDISKIPYSSTDSTNALVRLKENLTNATGTWKRSSMLNDGKKVTEVKDVAKTDDNWKDGWKVNEPFQEFVADQTPWTEPDVQTDYLVAVQDKRDTLPALDDYLTNLDALKKEAETKGEIKDVKIEYDLPDGKKPEDFENKMLAKPSLYTVPLRITVNYKDGAKPETYKRVARLKVIYQLMYPESLPKLANGEIDTNSPEAKQVLDSNNFARVSFINADKDQYSQDSKGSFGKNDRTLYYARKNSATGVKAPQPVGKDYDADGYHYVFKGWRKLDYFVDPAANSTVHTRTRRSLPDYSAIPLTTLFVNQPTSATSVDAPNTNNNLLTNEQIRNATYSEDTTYQAEYDKIPNVIDASQQDEIPDGYVATIFMPGYGRKWSDGSHRPKIMYIRHGKDREANIKFAQEVANRMSKDLSGFTNWQIYDAKNNKSSIFLSDSWNISTPRILVAEQTGTSDIKIPETVIGVGEGIPNLNKLVHNTDPKVSVSIDENAKVDVSKPGISTIIVNVTKTTDEIDKTTRKHKTVTTKLPVRVYVLPKVIADNDLPAEGTAAAKFVQKNYTKVTYVAGEGGEMKSPVFTYWVRKGAKDLHMPVPDVLAANGYVFKDWTSITTETPVVPADRRKATAEEREALARLAKIDGMHNVAKLISDSRNFTLADLQNLLNEGRKKHAEQIYNAKREELAQIAESEGKAKLASDIRKSNDSLQNIKYELTKSGIDVDKIIEQLHEKTLLVKIAQEAGKTWLAKQISNYKHSSIEALKNLMREAGIDLTFANYEVTNKSNVSDEQRELLAEIADDANKPFVAKIIRSSKKSSLEVLKQVLRNAGVDLYAVPAYEPKKEITVTANFELMKPMRFEFRSSAISGIPATFTLANLTENSSGNETVSVGGVNSPINALTPNSPGSNGLLPSCTGTTCKISGTPKIVDGKPKVEVKFTTVDQYGRRAEIVVYIDVVDSAKPEPTPDPTPTPTPTPEPDYSTGPSDYVVPAYEPAPVPAPVPVVPLQDKQKTGVKGDLLPQTGVDASQSALIASLLASVGFAGFTAKHRRKREDGKNN